MRYAATVESLIAKWNEPENFVFEICPILHVVREHDGTEHVTMTYGDKNFHETILPIMSDHATFKQTATKLFRIDHKHTNLAYNAMVKAVNKFVKSNGSCANEYNSLDEALISAELKGFDHKKIVVIYK